jgi:uncharacterized protein (DUF885 family)
MKLFNLLFAAGIFFFLLISCDTTEDKIKKETAKANAFFDKSFDAEVNRSPEYQTYLGMQTDNDKWDDRSDAFAQKELDIVKSELNELKTSINYELLDEQAKISYNLFVLRAERHINNFPFRFHNYPLNQMYGEQSQLPTFLLNFHQIRDSVGAAAYISRINALPEVIEQVITGLQIREEKNIIPPKFVFNYVKDDIDKVIESDDLIEKFKSAVDTISALSGQQKSALLANCEAAIKDSFVPSFEKLKEYAEVLEQKATSDDGVWKFPDGINYYNMRLVNYTTTNMTWEEIHQVGLDEVKRIHGEMEAIKEKVGFKGSLQKFFTFMRNDKQFYYSNSDDGRQAYLEKATEIINTMKEKLPELFITMPKAELLVKRVEEFREKSAGKAFYNRPAIDGSRPAYYYANLYNMKDMPKYEMEALAYHEGVPGHHMQLAIAQELQDIPKFRKHGSFTAYIEGWGLYSEYIPKEMGFYSDPYSDFGRLAMELWRACRLVVDTGIHAKKWTREQGIAYYMENTPGSEGGAIKMVERHIVMAGQATAYKIGMLKILELRDKAQQALGEKFNIRQFHDYLLTSGPLPLNVLEARVDTWIKNISAENQG